MTGTLEPARIVRALKAAPTAKPSRAGHAAGPMLAAFDLNRERVTGD